MTSPSLLLLLCILAPPPSPQLPRWTLDGGGMMSCRGGALELSGTIGQPDAGLLNGGELALSGGFWFAPAAADCNVDGCVDLVDFRALPVCLSGPAASVATGCTCSDIDRDNHVDLSDFAGFQRGFTGA